MGERTEDASVPPLGNLRVARHQTSVNVGLFVHGAASLGPDLLAEVKERMRKSGSDRGK